MLHEKPKLNKPANGTSNMMLRFLATSLSNVAFSILPVRNLLFSKFPKFPA